MKRIVKSTQNNSRVTLFQGDSEGDDDDDMDDDALSDWNLSEFPSFVLSSDCLSELDITCKPGLNLSTFVDSLPDRKVLCSCLGCSRQCVP